MRWLIALVVIGGCYSPRSPRCEPCSGVDECPGGLACIAGKCRDNAAECGVTGDDARICYGINKPPLVELCPTVFSDPITNLTATIDTDFNCDYVEPATANNPPLCVILADHISAPETTTVTGSRPLVLLARTMLEIEERGELDLAGSAMDAGPDVPAGANVASCAAPHGTSVIAPSSGGGGPGGTFQGRGGTGGAGAGAVAVASTALDGGALALRGGCRGGDGGNTSQLVGGLGGTAGGAIYLLAPAMTIDGVINASGGGARVSDLTAGGGGGGSGGMILIWTVEPLAVGTNAQIFALGGGGGSGGSLNMSGTPGDDPDSPTVPAMPSIGPSGSGTGGKGGGGGERDGGAGTTPNNNEGGGGGGGGVGFIKIHPLPPASSQIAPPSS